MLTLTFAVPAVMTSIDNGERHLHDYAGLLDLARSIDGSDVGAAPDAMPLAEAQVLYAVISALLAGDASRLAEKIHYLQVACTDIGALGGPPLCRDGEEVGAIVEGLPLLEAEGVIVRADEMQPVMDALLARRPAIVELLADPREVYREEAWHPARAGILLVGQTPDAAIALLTDEVGIVRIYYGRTADEVRARVLAPAR